ncbi:MAG: response regulator [Arenimonas sp.]|nr:response regulator [Arenimonas sp.]
MIGGFQYIDYAWLQQPTGRFTVISIFLLDDHSLVRTGYRLILQQHMDMQVVGEAETGEDGLQKIRALKPDVVLCDLHMPGLSGLEITERLNRGSSPSKVIIVSVQQDGPMPKRLLEAGASGYLGKACDAEELVRAIRDVARGKRYLANELAQKMALCKQMDSPFELLSAREIEISLLFCQGWRAEDMAKKLCVSSKTIATHKYRILDKLGIHDTIALARLAALHGITEPTQVV